VASSSTVGAGGSGGTPCVNTFAPHAAAPEKISESGLYAEVASGKIHPAVKPFKPRYELWSDAANKQRWIYLPECAIVDTSNMNDWVLPVGTRLFKEFVVNGKRVETRLIERVGSGANDFLMSAYLWNDAQTEAVRVPSGVKDANGTSHDVPSEADCRRCHGAHEKGGGRPSRALGFSALQLSHDESATTLASLAKEGKLSAQPTGAYAAPGNDIERLALGILHANCGHCHNATKDRVPQVDLDLWLDVDAKSVTTTSAYLSAVGRPNQIFQDQHVTARIVPGKPDESAVAYRMGQRGNNAQMPPLATEMVNTSGSSAVAAWITSLK
jgi:hypothetical protein